MADPVSVADSAAGERSARVGEIELAYETFGDPCDPTLLLIMGLGGQMLLWDPDLCAGLAERGLHVVRFDNRDVGLSTKTPGPPPRLTPLTLWARRPPRGVRYRLDDMAADAVGLLDHLAVHAAHVMGASMGGMIAQTVAIRHPRRVRSLVSIMSTTGNRRVGRQRRGMTRLLLSRPPRERQAYIDRSALLFRAVGSPGYPIDEERIREVAARSYDRCFHPAGPAHQLAAILSSGDRTAALRAVSAPTLVIHGADDPLVTVSGGQATAAAIPDARLLVIPGMGHDMPRGIWPQMIDAVVANADRASA